MTVFEIDAVSDFVCLWCFIAKRNLDHAVALYQKTYPGGKHDIFRITYRTYFLNYHISPSASALPPVAGLADESSVLKSEIAKTKLAHMSEDERDALVRRMERIARSVGIALKHGGKVGPTQGAHRLVYHAYRLYCPTPETDDTEKEENGITSSPEECTALVDALFMAYHEREVDISSQDELLTIAMRTIPGLDSLKIEAWLDDPQGAQAIEDEAKHYKERLAGGGVPSYIINKETVLLGTQDIEDWIQLFIALKEKQGK